MEKVTFGDASNPGYECGDKSAPAVVVLQEWWGVTETIKRQALKLHTDGGFRVIVPDLYKGELGVDAEEAHHLMTNLDWPNAKAELVECARYLKATGSPKVGVVGFCMGGALALIAAQHADDVTCAAPFYGTPDPGICQTEQISKPVQAHFGAMDNLAGFSDPDAATKLLANLQAAERRPRVHERHAGPVRHLGGASKGAGVPALRRDPGERGVEPTAPVLREAPRRVT